MGLYSSLRRELRSFYLRVIRADPVTHEGPFNFFVFDDDPLILLTFTPSGLGHVRTMAEQVTDRPSHFLVGFWWCMEDAARVDSFAQQWKEIRDCHGDVTLTVLCNTREELALFERRTDLDARFVNQNCLIDESIWEIRDDLDRKYDAVYNARMGPYKRLELASDVERLAIITVPYDGDMSNSAYARRIQTELAHADWLNFDGDGSYSRLSYREVNRSLNAARSGLILSSKEGACYAVVEYLLSGVPVVSTRSKGGRSVWFDSETAIVVDDTRKGVRDGVETWKRRGPDPHAIRERTLQKMRSHRHRLFDLVDEIRTRHGKSRSIREDWDALLVNKMTYKGEPDEFTELLDREKFDRRVRARKSWAME